MVTGKLWRVAMLGGLRLEGSSDTVTRFRSQKIAALLAYLALFPRRTHTREELADLFWPDADLTAGRTNLRTGLASLRRQLEPPGIAAGSVLVTRGHNDVLLNPDAYETDVAVFETLVHEAAQRDISPQERVQQLSEAIMVYGGPLLPGNYEDWALTERERLAEMYTSALRDLARLHETTGDWNLALETARRAISADPLSEEAHLDVLRLLMASGQTAAAKRHYQEIERLFEEELGIEPPAEARALLASAPAVPTPRKSVPTEVPAATAPVTLIVPEARPETPVHLPLTLTRFFGRDTEGAQIAAALRGPGGARLLTLTGAGGSGKTRLAIETARVLAPDFPGGVWFVPLAEMGNAERFFEAIAVVLRLPQTPAVPPQKQVLAALTQHGNNGPLLLILDNFEQIVDDGTARVADLLAVSSVSCLVTSRRKLLLDGEYELALPPLATPDHAGSPARLLEFPSVQLFVSRAQAARPDFQLTERNAAPISQLCRHLEGIPLALELAAAWAQTLSPAQMLERLARRFDLLVSRRRDVPRRHATLRATVAWSYQLLSHELKGFFAGLSVFTGGWTLDAAGAVLGEPHALEYIAELQDRSLIYAADEGPDDASIPRFRMLETLREFAVEQIPPEERSALEERHAGVFLALAEEAREHLTGADPGPWLERLDREQDNFRAALDRASTPQDDDTGLRLAAALARFWEIRGYWREGRDRLTMQLTPSDRVPDSPAACRALYGAAMLSRLLGDYVASEGFCRRGLEMASALDDEPSQASFLTILGVLAQYRGDLDGARQLHTDSLAISRRCGNLTACGMSLHNLGRLAELRGNHQESMAFCREALDIFRAQGNRRYESMCLSNLGNGYYQSGDLATARVIYEECLVMQREVGHRAGMPISLFNLGSISLRLGDEDDAGDKYRQSLRLTWEQGNKRHACLVLEGLAAASRQQGEQERSVRLLAAADSLRNSLQASLEWGEETLNPPVVRAEAQSREFQSEWESGKRMTPDQAVLYALEEPTQSESRYRVVA